MHNDHAELDRFKTEINLSQFAASRGYTLDKRESSRNSAVIGYGKESDQILMNQSNSLIFKG